MDLGRDKPRQGRNTIRQQKSTTIQIVRHDGHETNFPVAIFSGHVQQPCEFHGLLNVLLCAGQKQVMK